MHGWIILGINIDKYKNSMACTSSSSASEICGAGRTSLLLFLAGSAFSILGKYEGNIEDILHISWKTK